MLGKIFNINLNVRNIGEYIKGFELPENYTDTGYLLYNGNVIGKYPKYVTVFYTDGSSERLSDMIAADASSRPTMSWKSLSDSL